MADITPIRSGEKSWGSKAAAGDALNRVPNDAPFVAVWTERDEKGELVVKFAKANADFVALSAIALVMTEFAQSCVRSELERR